MKAVILMASLMSTSLMAKTIVKVPFTVEFKGKTYTAREINKNLKLQGEDKLLEEITVEDTLSSNREANKIYWAQSEKVDQIAQKLNLDMYLELGNPDGSCYIGKAAEAVGILSGLTDGPFSDQMGLWGWKYKKEVHLEEGYEESEQHLMERNKAWKNWKGNDESILIITHVSDDGDDMITNVVNVCK
ncbi:hypothetical protein C0V70_15535 [Bacteriovorax stolpii]|uniref:Uncharacterized protein n=1 Tax=Bacteriovorax stolpii TaxID=960 RepID=A0A2K9NVE5_BACTC|nr:hypothetical protein [Bacteriovorax stolpii]AUN99491.1 hypothetical protein C0V70_15535 [Bacteriovorax stolpii]TDP51118.1 hypothetical protein C8D79_3288 [Bacteriovorax stolpii]